MKRIFSILLISIFLLQAWSYSAIYISFMLNRNYISAKLCENRNMPSKHCCGKCYLAKELKKQQNADNKPLSLKNSSELTLFCQAFAMADATKIFKKPGQTYQFQEKILAPHTGSLFHPPLA